jgi:uncharacterized protein (DUF486 family)
MTYSTSIVSTVVLLVASHLFNTLAWCGHLRRLSHEP